MSARSPHHYRIVRTVPDLGAPKPDYGRSQLTSPRERLWIVFRLDSWDLTYVAHCLTRAEARKAAQEDRAKLSQEKMAA